MTDVVRFVRLAGNDDLPLPSRGTAHEAQHRGGAVLSAASLGRAAPSGAPPDCPAGYCRSPSDVENAPPAPTSPYERYAPATAPTPRGDRIMMYMLMMHAPPATGE